MKRAQKKCLLSPDDVRDLVAKAFVLEAITDKPGCTTRYEDLPGKPLQDFVLAGINCSRYFALSAEDYARDPAAPLFAHNLGALRASNAHKSSKYVNFGLLEIMFPVVRARIGTDEPAAVIDSVIDCIKASTNRDVRDILQTRKLAWSTSTNTHKAAFDPKKYEDLASVWDYYMVIYRGNNQETSGYQWTNQYLNGLPILRTFFEGYQGSGEVMHATERIFLAQKACNPAVPVGILADMCAAAIFLWLSFNERPV